jgi:hypothetical protein
VLDLLSGRRHGISRVVDRSAHPADDPPPRPQAKGAMTETKPPAPAPAPRRPAASSIIIRPWPKIVFLYPTFIVSTLFWLVALFAEGGGIGIRYAGNLWMAVFVVNLLVFSFDFSRIKSITLLFLIVAIVLGIGWANTQWDWITPIKDVYHKIDVRMNTQFYGFASGFLAFVLLLVLVNTRFNYYEINHREILHHHGYLGDITRMPTQGLRFNKEIYDLLEYLLLRSGRLILYPATSREAIVLDNVINVNKVEDRIKDLLSVVAVRVEDGTPATAEEL